MTEPQDATNIQMIVSNPHVVNDHGTLASAFRTISAHILDWSSHFELPGHQKIVQDVIDILETATHSAEIDDLYSIRPCFKDARALLQRLEKAAAEISHELGAHLKLSNQALINTQIGFSRFSGFEPA